MHSASEISDVHIVLLGNFNPMIFQPIWFEKMEILPKELIDAAEIEVIHPELVSFQTDWLSIRVEKGRFTATTQEAPWVRLSDLVVRTFKEFLPHTPISKMGINRRAHFSVGNEEVRNQIGKRLAPSEPWGEWGQQISTEEEGVRHGGMRLLVMEQNPREDGKAGFIRTKIEPSTKISMESGISMEINDHYQLDNTENLVGCEELIEILNLQFERSLSRSEWIIDQIKTLSETIQETLQ